MVDLEHIPEEAACDNKFSHFLNCSSTHLVRERDITSEILVNAHKSELTY